MEFSERLKELRTKRHISGKACSRYTHLEICRCKIGERLGVAE